MRIVAGTARGRKLVAPDGVDTRPTGDRVREAVFNALFSLDDAVAGARVLDLFAGTGALGLEAVSRGAAHVTFVERNPKVIRCLEANVVGTGADPAAITVVRAEALDWLARRGGGTDTAPFDVALLDPPYDFAGWAALLDALPATLAVIESNRDVMSEAGAAARWETIRHRRYGATVVTMIRRLATA
jgi:16S rRNA (guanine966-N2)-methyltransferase